MSPENARRVLEDVPKIGYHIHLCPFVGSLVACMEYLGTPYDYDMLMGFTGAAFRRLWNPNDGGNIDLLHYGEEPVRRAFRVLGYTCSLAPHADRERLTRAIIASIDRGVPVLAFGIIGPPECGIVTGYADGGETLVGYSYFQDPSLPGYYEQPNWYASASFGGENGAIIIHERSASGPAAPHAMLPDTLHWILQLGHGEAPVPDHTGGLAAYEGWAAGMEADADFPADNPEKLAWQAMLHGDQAVMLEERRCAAIFLRRMADVAPAAGPELYRAAELYEQAAAQMPGVWLWGSDMGPDMQRALAPRATRQGIARAIRDAGAMEARALDHIAAALHKLT